MWVGFLKVLNYDILLEVKYIEYNPVRDDCTIMAHLVGCGQGKSKFGKEVDIPILFHSWGNRTSIFTP